MSRDPFRDIPNEKAPDSQHFRLISEGGCTLSKSPQPVCIDSIQVSQTCTTESRHTVYRSATGACTMFPLPDHSLFSVPPEHATELDLAMVPSVLRTRFEQQGIPLSSGVLVEVQLAGRIWFISDQHGKYSIRKLASHLTVFRDVS
jgi:hypothetical protein